MLRVFESIVLIVALIAYLVPAMEADAREHDNGNRAI